MNEEKNSPADIIKDLESIYEMAIASESFSVALKAKELLGREHGLFMPKKKTSLSLADLTNEDLERLIVEIENELILDRSETGE